MFALLVGSGSGNGSGSVPNLIESGEHQITLALIGVGATLVAALVYVVKAYTNAKVAAEQATAANQAVNNVGPGQHNLYDMVASQSKTLERLVDAQNDFTERGWRRLPDDLSTSAKLTETIRELQHHDHGIDETINTILEELRAHVQWELQVKWESEHHNGDD